MLKISRDSKHRKYFEVFIISFLFLFLEIALIRWISGYVKIVAYFTNMLLISAFLGGGIGLLAKNRKYVNYFPAIILLLFLSAFTYQIAYSLFFSASAVSIEQVGEKIETVSKRNIIAKLLLPEGEWIWNTSTFLIYLVPIFFLLNALVFIPVGQILGDKMEGLMPLKAYTINILGSLFGIIALSLMSFFSIQPFWWFLLSFILYFPFLTNLKFKVVGILLFVVSLIIVSSLGTGTFWSPYYKIISTKPNQFGEFTMTVNDDSILSSLNFSRKEALNTHYVLPYLFKKPSNVLIVGAGTGNDAYLAILNDVKEIDAVEIDPIIISFANKHPNKPYNNENVNVILNDARNFIKNSDKKYDMVVYGLLDSHRVFAHQSSVRLDNFVYTKEAIEEAKKILKSDGVIVLSFWVGKDFIEAKIYRLLKNIFNKEPLVISTGNVKTFVVGENLKKIELPSGSYYTKIKDLSVIIPSDDYPFLYLKNKLKDTSYIRILISIFLIAILLVMFSTPGIKSLSWHFFFLGTGFLLIETKSITEIALIFGSTWIVNSFVIASVLIMVLLANYYTSNFKINASLAYLLLALALAINFVIKPSSFLQNNLLSKVFAVLIISLPVFFSGLIFASSFKNVKDIHSTFGSNILGSVLGGSLEYSSLIFGIKSLYITAFVAYILSFILNKR